MSNNYDYKGRKITILQMPFGETTTSGAYYAKVDGDNIGINSRTHWESESSARLAAETYINAQTATA